MKFVVLALAMMATATALYIPAQESHLEERGTIVDFATKLQTAIDNIKHILASGSDEKRDLDVTKLTKQQKEAVIKLTKQQKEAVIKLTKQQKESIKESIIKLTKQQKESIIKLTKQQKEEVLAEIKKLYNSETKQTVKKVQDMIARIKDIVASGASEDDTKEKRSLAEVAKEVGGNIEIIILEGINSALDGLIKLKNHFSAQKSSKRGLMDHVNKINDFGTSLKSGLEGMLMNVYGVLKKNHDKIQNDLNSDTKRGAIVDGAQKVEEFAKKIQDMIARIKDIVASDAVDKRGLMDHVNKINDFGTALKSGLEGMLMNVYGVLKKNHDKIQNDLNSE